MIEKINIQEKNENQPNPESKTEAVMILANEFHEDWRKTRLNDDGSYEPRVKETSDQSWIESHGTNQVDIANSKYIELPTDWQAENKAAADVIVDIFEKNNGQINLDDEDAKNNFGEEIHSAWLKRNSWAKGGELDVPFTELPEAEQNKDIDQIIVAKRVFEI